MREELVGGGFVHAAELSSESLDDLLVLGVGGDEVVELELVVLVATGLLSELDHEALVLDLELLVVLLEFVEGDGLGGVVIAGLVVSGLFVGELLDGLVSFPAYFVLLGLL